MVGLLNHPYNYKWICFVVIMLVATYARVPAQTNHHVWGIRPHYGFIIAHSRELRKASTTYPRGLEIEKSWQLTSFDAWKYCFCYPKAGVSFFYVNFDNPSVLGEGFALASYIEPVWNIHKNLYSTFRFGTGPVYLNTVYDEETNPTNTFYSAPVSFIVLLRYSLNYRFNNGLNVSLSPTFNHISNGGIRNPNKGINFPTLGLGLEYTFGQQNYPHWETDRTEKLIDYQFRFDMIGFATGKTARKAHARYLVKGVATQISFPIGRINALTAGMEFTVDNADKKKIERNQDIDNATDHRYLAVIGGHEWLFGRFNFGVQLGAYLYSPYKRHNPVYHRWNLTYYFTDHIFAGVNLKAHAHVADFLGMRMGYSLFKNNP